MSLCDESRPLSRPRFHALSAALGLCALIAAAPPALAAETPPVAPPAPLSIDDARAIVEAVREAPELAAPPNLDATLAWLSSPDPQVAAQADTALTLVAQTLAAAEHGLVRAPSSVDREWALKTPYDAASDFTAARASGRVADWARALPRRNPAYLALVAARSRYAAMATAGGWAPLPAGPALKPGAADPRIPGLRARLAAEGFTVPAPPPAPTPPPVDVPKPDQKPGLPHAPAAPDPQTIYDPALATVVADFQAHHALSADGVLTAATVAALNVPVQDRLAALDANLERSRWLPDQLPPDRIEVDIAAAQATLFEGARAVLTMRAIVGDPKHHTPIFVSKVTGIVFNPPWVVPTSIANAEIYPKARRDPGYFARNDFSIIGGQIVQAPGPKASLGYVKIDLVSPFGVYLHDTPARSLFNRDRRALSHGCMRLQKPRELAAALMAPRGWTLDTVNDAIAAGATTRVTPPVQTPVYVVYRTAEAAAAGPATFRPDVYGWDAKLTEAIGRR